MKSDGKVRFVYLLQAGKRKSSTSYSRNLGRAFRRFPVHFSSPSYLVILCLSLYVSLSPSLSFLWITERDTLSAARTNSLASRDHSIPKKKKRNFDFLFSTTSEPASGRAPLPPRTSTRQSGKHQGKPKRVGMLRALPHMYVLSDKTPWTLGFLRVSVMHLPSWELSQKTAHKTYCKVNFVT